jgi:glyoxylase-like metal-dependent hydrolase (beta-lactamase superfamily II)
MVTFKIGKLPEKNWSMKQIADHLHQLSLKGANGFLIDHGSLTLVDTGYGGNSDRILAYIKSIGKKPQDLQHILLTHLHSDHTGSLAELQEKTDAEAIMSAPDAECVLKGQAFRAAVEITPGLLHKLIYRLFVKGAPRTVNPPRIDRILTSQDEKLPIGKGFTVIPVPGHAAGQIALLYHDDGGTLFAADTCGNMAGLALAPFYEDYHQGLTDLHTIANYRFERIVVGHGNPILKAADERFEKRFNKYFEKSKRRNANAYT